MYFYALRQPLHLHLRDTSSPAKSHPFWVQELTQHTLGGSAAPKTKLQLVCITQEPNGKLGSRVVYSKLEKRANAEGGGYPRTTVRVAQAQAGPTPTKRGHVNTNVLFRAQQASSTRLSSIKASNHNFAPNNGKKLPCPDDKTRTQKQTRG